MQLPIKSPFFLKVFVKEYELRKLYVFILELPSVVVNKQLIKIVILKTDIEK